MTQGPAGGTPDDGTPPVERTVVPADHRLPGYVPEQEPLTPGLLFRRIRWRKVALFTVSLFLFVLAITLMREGARDLAPMLADRYSVQGIARSLGSGWLFAYILMSGSPVAAAALTFFDAGVIDQLSAFAMISGSRLGASLIVLFIGFIYVLRGRDRVTSLSMGMLSLTVTGTTQAVGLVIGLALLSAGVLDGIQLPTGAMLSSLFEMVFDPIVALLLDYVPRWVLFPVGIGVIMGSFSLFDRSLPQMSVRESRLGQFSVLVYRPWVMFFLGASITLVSMSVSLSLSILVPLSDRGLIRRENVIPYILGANITTFVDTLLAAVLLGTPAAFTVVLAQMVSITLVSLFILGFAYAVYERSMLRFVNWSTGSNRNLALFLFAIFLMPFLLLVM